MTREEYECTNAKRREGRYNAMLAYLSQLDRHDAKDKIQKNRHQNIFYDHFPKAKSIYFGEGKNFTTFEQNQAATLCLWGWVSALPSQRLSLVHLSDGISLDYQDLTQLRSICRSS